MLGMRGLYYLNRTTTPPCNSASTVAQACTFWNRNGVSHCSICGTRKPPDESGEVRLNGARGNPLKYVDFRLIPGKVEFFKEVSEGKRYGVATLVDEKVYPDQPSAEALLWRVNASGLRVLDFDEGYPELYDREMWKVYPEGAEGAVSAMVSPDQLLSGSGSGVQRAYEVLGVCRETRATRLWPCPQLVTRKIIYQIPYRGKCLSNEYIEWLERVKTVDCQ